jgi:putative tryptophan/tyrosine transport system substrate-binding protein
LNVELAPKKLELPHELIPSARTLALLVNPTNAVATEHESRTVQAAARSLGLQIHILNASTERDFDPVVASLAQRGVGALVIGSDLFFTSRAEQLAALTVRHTVPSIYQFREFVAAGGLMSYGGSFTEAEACRREAEAHMEQAALPHRRPSRPSTLPATARTLLSHEILLF